MKKITALLAAFTVSLLSIGSASAQTVYYLNFTSDASPDPVTYNGVNTYQVLHTANFNTLEPESWNIGGGLTLSFASVNNYALPDTLNPLVASGVLTTSSSAFSISGLTPGSTVDLYAIAAWDGPGRAAYVSFGSASLVDSTATDGGFNTSSPGTNVTLADLQLIDSGVLVGPGGTLSGSITNDDGVNFHAEGQLGGFAIVVTPGSLSVPEPSTYVLLGIGGFLLFVVARRRRALI